MVKKVFLRIVTQSFLHKIFAPFSEVFERLEGLLGPGGIVVHIPCQFSRHRGFLYFLDMFYRVRNAGRVLMQRTECGAYIRLQPRGCVK